MKRLLIVADHPATVQTIRLALRQTAGFQVVGFVDGRGPVAHALTDARPDVVLVDDMAEREWTLDRLSEAAEMTPDAQRIVLTGERDAEAIDRLFEAGAETALSKSVHPIALGTLLREVCNGNVINQPRVPRDVSVANDCPLTEREVEILGLVAQGRTNSAIAQQLWVTEQTVKFHLSNTYRKLGVANRTEASRYAYVHDLVPHREKLAV